MLAIGAIFIQESPRWLASRDRNEAALKNLAYLRGLPADHQYVQDEFEDIQVALESDRAKAGAGFMGPIKALFSEGLYVKRLLIAVALFACQNGTGINAINYYSPKVFASIGVTGTNTALLTTGVFGLLKFAGAVVWLLFLVDRYGRRMLLIVGSVGGAFAMYWIAIYIALADPEHNPTAKLSSGGISAVAAFYIW
jgi:MFS family permease